MVLTALQEYGIRCLLQLAKQPLGQLLTVRQIADAEGLSTDYVEKILNYLRSEGLTTSIRGAHGGYLLTRPANEITLGEALRALGDVLYGRGFCDRFTGVLDECVHLHNCGIRPVWAFLTREIYRILSRTTLADFLQEEAVVVSLLPGKTRELGQKEEKGEGQGNGRG